MINPGTAAGPNPTLKTNPTIISGTVFVGTMNVNYRNEPVPLRVDKGANTTHDPTDPATDLAFTFASMPVGTYTLTVEATGFQSYKADGISLGGGEKRNVNVSLAVGATSQTVEVNAEDTAIVTTDSGEKSFTLETKELQNFVQVGANAAEYIKIVPGFGIQNGTSNKANYNGATIGINANGDSGSQSPLNAAFSYNGLPTNSLDITSDESCTRIWKSSRRTTPTYTKAFPRDPWPLRA